MSDCAICFEPFNKSSRKAVACPYCSGPGAADPVVCCKRCTETYLLEDDAPMARCPNTACRTPWSEDFLSDTMTASFLTGAYKVHRERVLLDTERARLPESQEDAVRYRAAKQLVDRCRAEARGIMERYTARPDFVAASAAQTAYRTSLRQAGWSAQATRTAHEAWTRAEAAIREEQHAMFSEIRVVKNQVYRDAKEVIQRAGLPPPVREGEEGAGGAASAARPKETRSAWTFVMKCTQEGCEGFVGTNWKCGLCSVAFCKDCREPNEVRRSLDCREPLSASETTNTTTTTTTTSDHVCNEEKRLTVAALRKEAKPCPKCAALISKIDGCDQMWCTQCKTAFSWRTGTIEENHVHNPHYFEWMRRNGGLAPVPQHQQLAGGDVAGAGCWAPQQVQNHLLRYPASTERPDDTMGWIRMIRHYEWEVRRLRRYIRDEDEERRVLRVKRLVNDIDDTAWKVKLQRAEKARHKRMRVCQVLETFTQAGIDVMRGFLDARADQPALYQQLRDLQVYCNEQLQRIASRYKNEVPHLVHSAFVPNMLPAAALLVGAPAT